MALIGKDYQTVSDERLMKLIKKGDTKAFNQLYSRYGKRLLHYFFRMLGGDREKSQDLLQDIFLKIIRKPELFNGRYKFKTWIFSVAHNMCKNEYRRLSNRDTTLIESNNDIADNPNSFDQRIDQKLFQKVLQVRLNELPPDQRTAFLLRFQENLSIKEISKTMNCSEGTVKSRLFYACEKLAKYLQAFNPNKNGDN